MKDHISSVVKTFKLSAKLFWFILGHFSPVKPKYEFFQKIQSSQYLYFIVLQLHAKRKIRQNKLYFNQHPQRLPELVNDQNIISRFQS